MAIATISPGYEIRQCSSLKGGQKTRFSGEVSMHILVENTGSSRLKFSLFEAVDERLLAEGGIDRSRHAPGSGGGAA
jgi:hypothetical protein